MSEEFLVVKDTLEPSLPKQTQHCFSWAGLAPPAPNICFPNNFFKPQMQNFSFHVQSLSFALGKPSAALTWENLL